MEIKNIQLENGPSRITVEMSLEEAIWIAKVAGKQRGVSPHNEIYACLVGEMFNRFWDSGLEEADDKFNVPIPPINYSEDKTTG